LNGRPSFLYFFHTFHGKRLLLKWVKNSMYSTLITKYRLLRGKRLRYQNNFHGKTQSGRN
jgi:hypothetical protein